MLLTEKLSEFFFPPVLSIFILKKIVNYLVIVDKPEKVVGTILV